MNPLKSSIIFIDGINTAEKGIHSRGRVEVPSPEQFVEHIDIKGRSGSLTKKYGYNDIFYPLEFYMNEGVPFRRAFRTIKMFLMQAKILSFSDDEEVQYLIKSSRIETADNIIETYGSFRVMFRLGPFQYEVEDSTRTITTRTTIVNEGYESEPIITAQVAGTGRIYINDQEIVIQNINGSIIIDSELMNAYRNNNGIITNLNNHMVGDFPILDHGSNVIEFDGDISRLEVNPRWRWV